jgi:hypothetical protein
LFSKFPQVYPFSNVLFHETPWILTTKRMQNNLIFHCVETCFTQSHINRSGEKKSPTPRIFKNNVGFTEFHEQTVTLQWISHRKITFKKSPFTTNGYKHYKSIKIKLKKKKPPPLDKVTFLPYQVALLPIFLRLPSSLNHTTQPKTHQRTHSKTKT